MDASQAATALLTEHLQYTPLSLIDDIIDSVNNLVYQGVGSLETGLISTPSERLGFKKQSLPDKDSPSSHEEYPEAKQEIEEGLHQLETLLNSTVDKNFDKFEIYVLRNVLSVPEDLVNWIQLGHYQGITYPPAQNVPTIESLNLVRQRLNASRSVSRALQQEKRRNDAILAQLRAVAGETPSGSPSLDLSFLDKHHQIQSHNVKTQQTLDISTAFAISQMPALQSTLADLRSKLPMLMSEPMIFNTANEERREERREYIEKQIMSHLERNGQTMTDELESTTGRHIEASELEALEKVADALHPA